MVKKSTTVVVDFKELTEHILNSYLNSNSEEDIITIQSKTRKEGMDDVQCI